jgi:hypothetical protein
LLFPPIQLAIIETTQEFRHDHVPLILFDRRWSMQTARAHRIDLKGASMKRMILSLFAGAAVCAAVLPAVATAQSDRGTINQRQSIQRERIKHGIRSGELTRAELARLKNQQTQLQVAERRAKADGEFTARERVRLQRALNETNRRIYAQTHDNQDRN